MAENLTSNMTDAGYILKHNSCASFMDETTSTLRAVPPNPSTHVYVHFLFDYVLLPVICTFGIIGNTLNLVILSQKRINMSLDRMEKSVYLGLIALAISDLCQCLFFLTFLYRLPEFVRPLSALQEMQLFFFTYREGLCNIFLFTSTWLMVLMALGRYVAICHPINARTFVKFKVTTILIATIVLVSVLVSLPYMWKYKIQDFSCSMVILAQEPPDCPCTVPYRMPGDSLDYDKYHIFWFIVEFLVPLAILVYCNIRLILSLKQSLRMQRAYRATKVQDPSIHITPTLVAVIFFFIILIAPTEIVKFVNSRNPIGGDLNTSKTVVAITNTLQSLNAAVNFILYCVINVHFRKTLQKLFCCYQPNDRHNVGSMRSDQIRTNHTSVMSNLYTDGETEL